MLKAIKYVTFNIFVFQSKLRKLNTLKDYLKLTQFSASKNKYKFPVTNEMLTIRMHLVCIINQLEQRAIDILHIVVKEMYLVPFFLLVLTKRIAYISKESYRFVFICQPQRSLGKQRKSDDK